MVKGWKAGLMALTALATTVPAFAQRGDWGGRGGQGGNAGGNVERQASPGGSGGERRGPGGGGWNRGGDQSAPSAPRPQMPGRNWSGSMGGDRGWQGSTPRPESRPAPGLSGQDRPGWQDRNGNRNWTNNGDRDRGERGGDRNWGNRDRPDRTVDRNVGRDNRDWDRGNRNWDRGNSNWGNRPGYVRPDGGRPDFGRPGFARPGNDWQDRGPRLSNSDRWRDQRRWSSDWRRDSRYDWQRYRQVNRGYYQLPAYRPPLGWGNGYSRFSIGVFLGAPLFGSSYWLDDPYSYRLPPAYGTMRWVRYYDDALLVDTRDGYVVDVIHDFFW